MSLFMMMYRIMNMNGLLNLAITPLTKLYYPPFLRLCVLEVLFFLYPLRA